MRAGIVDINVIADVNLRQIAVNGKLVVIFAQTAGHVVGMIAQRVFLAEHGDMVVCAVHRRTHEVCRAGVQTGILLIGMLLVDALGNQSAVRAKDKAAHLGIDGNIVHASRNKNLVVCLMHAFTDGHDVVRLLRRTVRNAYAAGQVDECDMHAGLLLHVNRQLEQDACQCRIVLIGNRVGGEECVNAEMLNTLLLHVLERFDQLLAGHAVLGLLRGIHDGVVQHEVAARIEAAGHGLLPVAYYLVVEIEVGNIIEIDDGVQVGRELVVLCRSNVGGEHDVMLLYAANIAELQLGQAGAVTAKAFLMQDLDETRVRRRLDGEVFLVSRIPRKCFLYLAGVLTDRLLIVNVERSRIGFGDLLHLLERQKGFLFHWCVRLSFTGVFNRYSYREFAQIDGAYRFPCAGSRFHRYQRYGRP